MRIASWGKGKTKKSFMVGLTPKEALLVIQSLSAQLAKEDSNSGRVEFYPSGAEYLSFAVDWYGIDTVRSVRAQYQEQLNQLYTAYRRDVLRRVKGRPKK